MAEEEAEIVIECALYKGLFRLVRGRPFQRVNLDYHMQMATPRAFEFLCTKFKILPRPLPPKLDLSRIYLLSVTGSSSRSGVSEGSNAASLASEKLDPARIERLHRDKHACLQEQQAVTLMSSKETIGYPVDFI